MFQTLQQFKLKPAVLRNDYFISNVMDTDRGDKCMARVIINAENW